MATTATASAGMQAYVRTSAGPARRFVARPAPAADETLVAVEAFSVIRGELSLLRDRPRGWRPGQDVAGRVLVAAADGTSPPAGAPVAAMVDVGDDLAILARLHERGLVEPVIGARRDWGELPAVLGDLCERRFPGKALLTVWVPA